MSGSLRRRQGLTADTGHGQVNHAEGLELSQRGCHRRLEGLGGTIGRGGKSQARSLDVGRPVQVQATPSLEFEVTLLHRVAEQSTHGLVQTGRNGRADKHDEQGVGRQAGEARCRRKLSLEVHNEARFLDSQMLFDTTLRRELARVFGAYATKEAA